MSVRHLTLPPLSAGEALTIDNPPQRMVIVGANGAGKSRFASRMAEDLADKAFTLSALTALFDRRRPVATPCRSVIDRLYVEGMEASMMTPDSETTLLDRVIWLMMRDEMINLLDYKLHRSEPTGSNAPLAPTHLDEVVRAWQEIFPENKILVGGGSMLFTRRFVDDTVQHETDRYSALRLSAGEKAVIYYLAAIGYAPKNSVVFVDSPEMFLHPTIMQAVWNRVEMMRPDCLFVYTTHDLAFASTRTAASVVWVRSFDARTSTWDYAILPPDTPLSDDLYASILGARKPVLFIEGDSRNSIDMKLYSLIFKDFTVRPLGSCNKVIEATRAFNDLTAFHQLDSYGIVDRDRRDSHEVDYLRRRRVMVPEVAEVENILMLEEVIRAVARHVGKNEDKVFSRVRRTLIGQFSDDIPRQALQHTRYRVKRLMEYRVDGRFSSIKMFEEHIEQLTREINPRKLYNEFVKEFNRIKNNGDYEAILRVYNQKSMLSACNVAGLCGMSGKDEYVGRILKILRSGGDDARRISDAVRRCFNLTQPLTGGQEDEK